ncbi:MAG: amidase [Pseudomonadota bacterium]
MGGFSDYDQYDGLGLAELVRRGDTSPSELLEEAIERTERVNGTLNAVTLKHYDEARAAIEAGLPEGPFTGVPFLLKDLHLLMQGTETTSGSGMWRGELADYDSTLVSRYKAAGLVTFGKTNSPELGLMPVTEPTRHGPSRNPWDPDRTPGGSSGGASAAVAAGIVPMANASDGGGSIRIPASCTGLVGLKPSRGRTPFGPVKGEGWAGQSISHVVSRSVRDSAAILDATTGPEAGDPYAAPHFDGTFLDEVGREPGHLRIAVSPEKWGAGDFHPEVREALDRTVQSLTDLGHHVEEAQPACDWDAVGEALFTIVSTNTALSARLRAEELGCSVAELDMEDTTREMIATAAGVDGATYCRAVLNNQAAGRALGRFYQSYDLILGPTLSSEPVPVGHLTEAADPDQYMQRLLAFMGDTGLFNQTGLPSISLPLQWSTAGLPIGMMFSAAFGEDALLLRLAGQLEKADPWFDRRAPIYAGAI